MLLFRTEVRQRLARIERMLDQIIKKESEVMAKIEDVIADVAAETTVIGGAVALLDNLHQMLANAGTDPTKLQALDAAIQGNKDLLAAAVARNTPVETAADQHAAGM